MKKIKQLSLIDYISIVGYYADIALVSKQVKKQCRGKSLAKLLEAGLYTVAVRYASYTRDNSDCQLVIQSLESKSQVPFVSHHDDTKTDTQTDIKDDAQTDNKDDAQTDTAAASSNTAPLSSSTASHAASDTAPLSSSTASHAASDTASGQGHDAVMDMFANIERVFGIYTDAIKTTKRVIYL